MQIAEYNIYCVSSVQCSRCYFLVLNDPGVLLTYKSLVMIESHRTIYNVFRCISYDLINNCSNRLTQYTNVFPTKNQSLTFRVCGSSVMNKFLHMKSILYKHIYKKLNNSLEEGFISICCICSLSEAFHVEGLFRIA